jgi:hypothetical protein
VPAILVKKDHQLKIARTIKQPNMTVLSKEYAVNPNKRPGSVIPSGSLAGARFQETKQKNR